MDNSVNRTIEILIHILGYLKEHNFDFDTLGEFSENLLVNGYDEDEVAEAFSLLFDKISVISSESTEFAIQNERSMRVLSSLERLKIPSAVFGYLLKLRSTNVISSGTMEKVIDYCMLMDPKDITESDIDEVIANLLFDEKIKEPGQI